MYLRLQVRHLLGDVGQHAFELAFTHFEVVQGFEVVGDAGHQGLSGVGLVQPFKQLAHHARGFCRGTQGALRRAGGFAHALHRR